MVYDQSPFVKSSVTGLITEGLIGAGFAILVIFVFLFSLRSTLVTAVSIPLSVVIALIGLWVGQFSLNILTLGGLTIAIGRVVDDSIVVLENIQRHLVARNRSRQTLDHRRFSTRGGWGRHRLHVNDGMCLSAHCLHRRLCGRTVQLVRHHGDDCPASLAFCCAHHHPRAGLLVRESTESAGSFCKSGSSRT